MHVKLAAVAVTAVVGSFALAPAARAHNVSVYPRYGAVFQPFVFTGTAWQPYRKVRVLYDQNADGTFEQTSSTYPNANGYFRFRWNGEDVADTHRMCFRQFDTRARFQRTFFKCKLFTANT
jgi:hypothetical protein